MRTVLVLLALSTLACGPSVSQADGDTACRSHSGCQSNGQCWYDPENSWARAMESSGQERPIGSTGVHEAQCVARSEADCRNTFMCQHLGNCYPASPPTGGALSCIKR